MNNHNHRYQPHRDAAKKPLVSYDIGLAFQRIHFYLDVLDAHFAALGVRLKNEADAGNATMQKHAREEKTKNERE